MMRLWKKSSTIEQSPASEEPGNVEELPAVVRVPDASYDATTLPLDQNIFVAGLVLAGKSVLLEQLAARAQCDGAEVVVFDPMNSLEVESPLRATDAISASGLFDHLEAEVEARLTSTKWHSQIVVIVDVLNLWLDGTPGYVWSLGGFKRRLTELLEIGPRVGMTVVVAQQHVKYRDNTVSSRAAGTRLNPTSDDRWLLPYFPTRVLLSARRDDAHRGPTASMNVLFAPDTRAGEPLGIANPALWPLFLRAAQQSFCDGFGVARGPQGIGSFISTPVDAKAGQS